MYLLWACIYVSMGMYVCFVCMLIICMYVLFHCCSTVDLTRAHSKMERKAIVVLVVVLVVAKIVVATDFDK